MTTTIKEVYEQCLANGWLGTERARVQLKYLHNNHNDRIISGISIDGLIVVQSSDLKLYREEGLRVVEWIGNQPKKKTLYAWAHSCNFNDAYSVKVYWSVKEDEDKLGKDDLYGLVRWLPEEQYPPIEIDASEEG